MFHAAKDEFGICNCNLVKHTVRWVTEECVSLSIRLVHDEKPIWISLLESSISRAIITCRHIFNLWRRKWILIFSNAFFMWALNIFAKHKTDPLARLPLLNVKCNTRKMCYSHRKLALQEPRWKWCVRTLCFCTPKRVILKQGFLVLVSEYSGRLRKSEK